MSWEKKKWPRIQKWPSATSLRLRQATSPSSSSTFVDDLIILQDFISYCQANNTYDTITFHKSLLASVRRFNRYLNPFSDASIAPVTRELPWHTSPITSICDYKHCKSSKFLFFLSRISEGFHFWIERHSPIQGLISAGISAFIFSAIVSS